MRRAITRWTRAGFVLALGLIGTGESLAQPRGVPPRPTRWVTDQVGFLTAEGRATLDARLEAYERGSGNQFIVWIGATSQPSTPEEFAVRAFEAWGVGQKGKDNGLALFIFAEERKVRLEVGYGLEGVLPDAIASRIVAETLLPALRAGNPDAAVSAAVEQAIGVLGGTSLAEPPTPARSREGPPLTTAQKVMAAILVIGFLILFITNPRLAIWLLINAAASSRGGGSRGGGGWSGGGGRSGGGGASGSW